MSRLNCRIAIAALMIAFAPVALAQDHKPSATITLSGGAVAVGVGYTWGNGELQFQGKKYPFSIDGLSIVDVGAARIQGVGAVYYLKNPEQFAGNYVAAGLGVTVAGGGSVLTMQNQNGVVIHLHSTQQGLKFNLSADGISIRMKS